MSNNMTNTVSPETGRRLAAAGFPQPAPAPGQWWSNGKRLVYVWNEHEEEEVETVYFTVSYYENHYPYPDMYFDARDFNGLVFLPTVGDLLRHESLLGYGVSMQYDTTESGLSWVCAPMEWSMPDMVSAMHETSEHEAAALAYISLHGTPADLDDF